VKRALLAVLASVAFGPLAHAKSPHEFGPPSKAVTPEIVAAIETEMNDAKAKLVRFASKAGEPPAYHISYKITEVEVNDVAASLGQTTTRRGRHFVNLEVRVRIGSTDFDNGNFVVAESADIDGAATASLPLEATARIARKAADNATERAFEEARYQLRAKMEARRAGATRAHSVPSWTAEKAIVSDEPVLVAPLETLDELEARARAVSAAFRDAPGLRDSHVAVTSYLERRWYLTTEGTRVADTRRASGIVIAANGQADDGQLLHQYFLRYGHTQKDLPSDDDLKTEAKKLAQNLVDLAKAPVIDDYSGPVLFEGEGAVGLVRWTLAPHLGGTPVPEGLNPTDARQFGGALFRRVGLRALAPTLSIVDDPTARETPVGGKALIGGYKIDDEGVAAQRVEVVKDGVLKTLLTSRTPSQKGQVSNGHARRPGEGSGGAFHGSSTNLFLIGKGGVPRKALEQRLVAAARAEGQKYGLIIMQLDDAAVSAEPESTRRELVQMIKSEDQQLPPASLLAYRLYPDGKRELVRGVQLAEVPVRAWKDVIATSTETTTYNYLGATESQLQMRLQAGTDGAIGVEVPSGGVESSITTPDILLKDIDVNARTTGVRGTPVVAKPK
jgi:predicted Zn-dependent protease